MEDMEAADDLLKKYQKHPFAKGLLPFGPTLEFVKTEFAKVSAKQDGRQRWLIIDKATGMPALFSHAAKFAQSDPIDTGNFVPPDEEIPPGLEVKNVQRRANSRCLYSYVLDTYTDLSMYEGQWTLDDYMATVKGFNPSVLPRRSYLSGQDPKYRSRFWLQTPMFLRTAQQKVQGPGLDHLHRWVVDADRQSKVFRANPDRPRVWIKDGDKILPISERAEGTLLRGDLIAFSFTVTYHITNTNWFPQFHPADIVVIREDDGDATDYSAPTIDLYSRPPPDFELGGSLGVLVGADAKTLTSGNTGKGQAGDTSLAEPSGLGGEEVKGSPLRRSPDTLGSAEDGRAGNREVFEFVEAEGEMAGVKGPEEFMDLVAEEEDRPVARASGSKPSRSARKHN